MEGKREEAINQLLTFKFDPKLKPDHAIGPPQVHGFADGGELENGAAIFLHRKLQDGSLQRAHLLSSPLSPR